MSGRIVAVLPWLLVVAGITVWAALREPLPALLLIGVGAVSGWILASRRRLDKALADARLDEPRAEPRDEGSHAEDSHVDGPRAELPRRTETTLDDDEVPHPGPGGA